MLMRGAHMVSPVRQGWNLARVRSARANQKHVQTCFVRRHMTQTLAGAPHFR